VVPLCIDKFSVTRIGEVSDNDFVCGAEAFSKPMCKRTQMRCRCGGQDVNTAHVRCAYCECRINYGCLPPAPPFTTSDCPMYWCAYMHAHVPMPVCMLQVALLVRPYNATQALANAVPGHWNMGVSDGCSVANLTQHVSLQVAVNLAGGSQKSLILETGRTHVHFAKQGMIACLGH
jgi:hypothetical protein